MNDNYSYRAVRILTAFSITAMVVSVFAIVVVAAGAAAERSRPGSGMREDITGLVSTNARQQEMRLGYWIALVSGVFAVVFAVAARRHWQVLVLAGALCLIALVLTVAFAWPTFSPSRYAGIPAGAYPQKPWPWPYVNAARLASEHSSDPRRIRAALMSFSGGAISATRVYDGLLAQRVIIEAPELSESDPPSLQIGERAPVHLGAATSQSRAGGIYDIEVEIARSSAQAREDLVAARRHADACGHDNLFIYTRRYANVFAAVGFCGATRQRLAPEIKIIDRLMNDLSQ